MNFKKKNFKFSSILFLFIFLLNAEAFSFENKIILKINNKIITTIDILNEVKYLKALNPNINNLDKDKIYDIAKNSLIREKIKETEISKLKELQISDDYINSIIEQVFSRIGIKDKETFINYLKNFDIDISIVEKKLTNEAIWNRLIFEKYNAQIKIDENEIKENLKLIKKKSISYLLSEIVFDVKDKNQQKNLIDKIKKSIKENGFKNTALIYSISDSSKTGGKLGWVNENTISKKIVNELNKIKKNQYTNPIVIPGGYLILYVEDIREIEKKIDIDEEYKVKVRNLQTLQLNQYSNIFFNKIKKNINIDEK
ncbi:peptidylprolyl isomerase [Candidatus Pelagibacter sp.]|uniref:peptidylprolyl isomerase n=1 Tax=Candidatus Pelagibacter sp. TaxID=2024849 RepID=UPI003F848EAC